MRFFSTDEKPSRHQYLTYLSRFTHYHDLNIETDVKAITTERGDDGVYTVEVERMGGGGGSKITCVPAP